MGVDTLEDGSIFITGQFYFNAVLGAGEPNETKLISTPATGAGYADIYIARYNEDGTLAWAISSSGTETELGQGISSIPDGSSIITGSFVGTAVFGKGEPNETELVAQGVDFDVFVARYNPDGALAWAKSAGGGDVDRSWGIDAFQDGSAIVTGNYSSPATFGLGEPNETILDLPLPDEERADIFIARFKP